MSEMFASAGSPFGELQDAVKMLFSTASLVFTAYFWLVRVNRERISVRTYPVSGFEGSLESGGVGVWSGKLFIANGSILSTAIVAGKVEIWWDGRWLRGHFAVGDGSELPWNLPPSQAFSKAVTAAFEIGLEVDRDQVYENQRLRFTFATVERKAIVEEFETRSLAVFE